LKSNKTDRYSGCGITQLDFRKREASHCFLKRIGKKKEGPEKNQTALKGRGPNREVPYTCRKGGGNGVKVRKSKRHEGGGGVIKARLRLWL